MYWDGSVISEYIYLPSIVHRLLRHSYLEPLRHVGGALGHAPVEIGQLPIYIYERECDGVDQSIDHMACTAQIRQSDAHTVLVREVLWEVRLEHRVGLRVVHRHLQRLFWSVR